MQDDVGCVLQHQPQPPLAASLDHAPRRRRGDRGPGAIVLASDSQRGDGARGRRQLDGDHGASRAAPRAGSAMSTRVSGRRARRASRAPVDGPASDARCRCSWSGNSASSARVEEGREVLVLGGLRDRAARVAVDAPGAAAGLVEQVDGSGQGGVAHAAAVRGTDQRSRSRRAARARVAARAAGRPSRLTIRSRARVKSTTAPPSTTVAIVVASSSTGWVSTSTGDTRQARPSRTTKRHDGDEPDRLAGCSAALGHRRVQGGQQRAARHRAATPRSGRAVGEVGGDLGADPEAEAADHQAWPRRRGCRSRRTPSRARTPSTSRSPSG